MGAAIVGTVEQVGIATILTVPLGILTATYLADSRSLFSRIVSYVVDAMTGAPAIIAGLFIYLFWVAAPPPPGKSGFAAGMALAVMMLPVVTRAAQEVVAIVPGSLREAALALGAPEWRVLLRVVLPTARAGLITAVILGVARIAGETAPVLFNAGGTGRLQLEPVHRPAGQPAAAHLRADLPARPVTVTGRLGGLFVLVLAGPHPLHHRPAARNVDAGHAAGCPGRGGPASIADVSPRQSRPRSPPTRSPIAPTRHARDPSHDPIDHDEATTDR